MQCKIIVLSPRYPAPPWRSPPTNRRPSDPVMPTPRKAITSMRICCKTSFWRLMSIRGTQFGSLAFGWSRFASVSARATRLVRSIRLGFLGPCSFRCETPPRFNGLRGLKRGDLFLELFSPAFEAPQQSAGLDRVRARSCDENLEPSQMNQAWWTRSTSSLG
jgi:hypothetical protein